ncbi:MAG: glutamyl-tRNA reductase, partial [Desulfocapsaceae bacterium]
MSKKHISLIGVNHKSTPLEIREKVALTGGYEDALARLRVEDAHEFYVLSTCNRVELIWVSDDTAESTPRMLHFLFGEAVAPEEWDGYSYVYHDQDAVSHLFKVSASLDSLVVGEAQILGQIKEAYRYASQHGCTG